VIVPHIVGTAQASLGHEAKCKDCRARSQEIAGDCIDIVCKCRERPNRVAWVTQLARCPVRVTDGFLTLDRKSHKGIAVAVILAVR
jgi:hypothetical protein